MNTDFSRCLALMRREKKVSQRDAARELGISQALLSHYENGAREPGLAFVKKACDYYNVSADYLLGRTSDRDGAIIVAEDMYDASEEKDNVLRGSVMATMAKKLLVNSISLLFDLLSKTENRGAIKAATQYFSTAIYKMFRHLYRTPGTNNEEFFSVTASHFLGGLANADMSESEVDYQDALEMQKKEKGRFPAMGHAALSESYPGAYQSLLQIIHTTGERMNSRVLDRRENAGK